MHTRCVACVAPTLVAMAQPSLYGPSHARSSFRAMSWKRPHCPDGATVGPRLMHIMAHVRACDVRCMWVAPQRAVVCRGRAAPPHRVCVERRCDGGGVGGVGGTAESAPYPKCRLGGEAESLWTSSDPGLFEHEWFGRVLGKWTLKATCPVGMARTTCIWLRRSELVCACKFMFSGFPEVLRDRKDTDMPQIRTGSPVLLAMGLANASLGKDASWSHSLLLA